MSFTINQSGDDVAEGTQGQVNLHGFFHSIACCTSLGCPFGPGQIDKVQFRSFIFLIPLIVIFLRIDVDGEDAVRPRRLSIHVGSSGGSVIESDVHILFHTGNGIDFELGEVFDENALVGAFLELHLGLDVLAEQVVDFLVVDFNETATYEVSLGGVVFGLGYYLTECSGDDSPVLLAAGHAHHGVSLAASGLSVGKDGAVVAI